MAKTYLGDGAYVDFDGYALALTTEDGIRVTNRIVLEPEVWHTLRHFVESLKAAPAPATTPAPNYCGICGEPWDDSHADPEQHASHTPDADPDFCADCGAELTDTGRCDHDHNGGSMSQTRYTVTLTRPSYEYAHVDVDADTPEAAETAALALAEAGEVDTWEGGDADRDSTTAIECRVDEDDDL